VSDYHPAFGVLEVEPYVSPGSLATICWTTLCHGPQRSVNHHCIHCIVCVIDRSCLLHFASSMHLLVHVFLDIRNFSAGLLSNFIFYVLKRDLGFLVFLISCKDKQSEVRPTTCHDDPEGVGGQRYAPAALSPGKVPTTCSTGGWVGPQGRSGGVRKISPPPPGFYPRTVQPVVPTLCQRTHIFLAVYLTLR